MEEAEKVFRSPVSGVTDDHEQLDMGSENQAQVPLEEQQILFTVEPSLVPFFLQSRQQSSITILAIQRVLKLWYFGKMFFFNILMVSEQYVFSKKHTFHWIWVSPQANVCQFVLSSNVG